MFPGAPGNLTVPMLVPPDNGNAEVALTFFTPGSFRISAVTRSEKDKTSAGLVKTRVESLKVSTPSGLKPASAASSRRQSTRSEEHTSELQSLTNLVCRLLLEKKNTE